MSEFDDPKPWVRPRLVAIGGQKAPLLFKSARMPDPQAIPPRQWLLGTQLLRGFVTVLVAPGGTGKSIYAMTAGLCVATKRPLLGLKVWQQGNVCLINEDSLDELDRRLAAAMIRHRIKREDLEGRFFLNSMDDRVVSMAERSPDGFTVVHPDEEALVQQILANNIAVLIVDPFAESHSLDENSNPDMIRAAAAWRRVARKTSCAIFLVHHVRKGATEGNIDAARGAKGLTDSARVGLIMQAMTELEAEQLGVANEERHSHVRVDDGKVNLSPRIDRAGWFKLETVELGNTSQIYLNGDRVAALVPWEPPALFEKHTTAQINLALDVIAAGPSQGTFYGPSRKGGTERWVGMPIIKHLEVADTRAVKMVEAWLETGLLFQEKYKNKRQGREQMGIHVDNSKRPL